MANVGIIQGTTPTVIFRITDENFDFSKIDNVSIVFECGGKYSKHQVSKKYENIDVDADSKTISVSLTQEETLKMCDGEAKVQLRIHMDDYSTAGQSLATPIQAIDIQPVLEKKVIAKYE